jgi:hypothetical protein
MEYYSALKMGNLVICKMNESENIMLNEINQVQKDRYCMISLLYESGTQKSRTMVTRGSGVRKEGMGSY